MAALRNAVEKESFWRLRRAALTNSVKSSRRRRRRG